jgi:protein-disulfide isomerase
MKPSYILLAAAAALAGSGCNSEKGTNGGTADSGTATTEAVDPPASGDWSEIVRKTPQGGFAMGNPNAEVKLVEFASMTCPHCATFEEVGVPKLIEQYVKSGKVYFELRNFVRDPFDITATLIARCNGADSYFPLTHALFKDQQKWVTKIQEAPQEQLQSVTSLGPDKQFVQIAQLANLQQWAAMRGVPTAKSNQCLTDQESINQLVQMNADATGEYEIPGTPSFLINGKLVESAADWQSLEPKIKAALGS